MSRITASTDFTETPEAQQIKFIDLFGQDVVRAVNGDLDFDTNFNAREVTFTFTAADTNTSIGHSLGRVPSRYILTSSTAAMSLYAATAASTSSTMFLRSSAIGVATVLIY